MRCTFALLHWNYYRERIQRDNKSSLYTLRLRPYKFVCALSGIRTTDLYISDCLLEFESALTIKATTAVFFGLCYVSNKSLKLFDYDRNYSICKSRLFTFLLLLLFKRLARKVFIKNFTKKKKNCIVIVDIIL